MSSKANQIQCKDVGCQRKGYWFEKTESGGLICFQAWHNGKPHVVKVPLEEIEQKLKASKNE